MMEEVMPPSTQEAQPQQGKKTRTNQEKAATRRRQRRAKTLKDARSDMLRALEEWAKPRPRNGVEEFPPTKKWFLAKGLFALSDTDWQDLTTSLPGSDSLFPFQGNARTYGGSKALDVSCKELFATVLSPYKQHVTDVKLIEDAGKPWRL
jgi:hypothetical protein